MQLWIYSIEIKGYSVILAPDFFLKNPLKIIFHFRVITLPGALAVPLPPLLWRPPQCYKPVSGSITGKIDVRNVLSLFYFQIMSQN
jgi:hypothetical protein